MINASPSYYIIHSIFLSVLFYFCISMIFFSKKLVDRGLSHIKIFLFIYLGSLFGNGQGKVLSVLVFFIFGIYIVNKIRKEVKRNYANLTHLF